ncbi:hypothetical protein Pelo_4795 [Pelomyxa schiedti]|nr:hypothetical protein Pelo_4795 [Pelomyxa schiedti]
MNQQEFSTEFSTLTVYGFLTCVSGGGWYSLTRLLVLVIPHSGDTPNDTHNDQFPASAVKLTASVSSVSTAATQSHTTTTNDAPCCDSNLSADDDDDDGE